MSTLRLRAAWVVAVVAAAAAERVWCGDRPDERSHECRGAAGCHTAARRYDCGACGRHGGLPSPIHADPLRCLAATVNGQAWTHRGGDVPQRGRARRLTSVAVSVSLALVACGNTLPSELPSFGPAATSGGPYILVYRPTDRIHIAFTAYDWNGVDRGEFGPVQICPSAGLGACHSLQFAPDGSRALDVGEVVGPTGASLGDLPQIKGHGYTYVLGGWTWADDSRNLCAVGTPLYSSPPAFPGGPAVGGTWPGTPNKLYVAMPNGPFREVATLDVGGSNDITTVLSCSMAADAALTLTQILPGGSDAVVRLSRLSSGSTVSQRRITLTQEQAASISTTVVASPDGRFVAISPADYNGTGTVLDLTSARSVAPAIPGRLHGFSYDGSRLVVSAPTGIRVVSIPDGKEVWTSTGSFCGLAQRPDAAHPDLAVCVGRNYEVWIVSARGTARHITDGGLAGVDAGP